MRNLKKVAQKFCLLYVVCYLFCCLLPLTAYAGAGDGSGGGQGVPLALSSSTPAHGSKGVAVTDNIELTFNKNIIALSVREQNRGCFSLMDSAGKEVDVEVIMADDQVNPELKRNITINPVAALKEGETYVLTIKTGLKAKNGSALTNDSKIQFTVGNPVRQKDEIAAPADNEQAALPVTDEITTEPQKSASHQYLVVDTPPRTASNNKQVVGISLIVLSILGFGLLYLFSVKHHK